MRARVQQSRAGVDEARAFFRECTGGEAAPQQSVPGLLGEVADGATLVVPGTGSTQTVFERLLKIVQGPRLASTFAIPSAAPDDSEDT